MDEFKKAMTSGVGPGGLKCNCCNDGRLFGRHKSSQQKRARRLLTKPARQAVKKIDKEDMVDE